MFNILYFNEQDTLNATTNRLLEKRIVNANLTFYSYFVYNYIGIEYLLNII